MVLLLHTVPIMGVIIVYCAQKCYQLHIEHYKAVICCVLNVVCFHGILNCTAALMLPVLDL